MYRKLFAYIEQHSVSQLTTEEETLIEKAFQYRKLRKKQYFLQEGDVCKYVGFIVKGAMRQFNVDDKGIEHIVYLFTEKNHWASDRERSIMLTNEG